MFFAQVEPKITQRNGTTATRQIPALDEHFKTNDPRFPKVIFNGKNCKYTLISMNNTKVIERNGKFDKDKNSERNKKILPEEATHFSDAADKRIWTKYGKSLYISFWYLCGAEVVREI